MKFIPPEEWKARQAARRLRSPITLGAEAAACYQFLQNAHEMAHVGCKQATSEFAHELDEFLQKWAKPDHQEHFYWRDLRFLIRAIEKIEEATTSKVEDTLCYLTRTALPGFIPTHMNEETLLMA